jgi:protein involved in plasmid replication-relaxation
MPKSGNRAAKAPLILSPKDIQILRFIAKARFSTAEPVAEALGSMGSLTTYRERLRRLSGGDGAHRYPLYRFGYPTGNPGNSLRVYCLTSRGGRLLRQEAGITPPLWQFRPGRMSILSYSFLTHALFQTSVLACVWRWQRQEPAYVVKRLRVSYELSRNPTLPVLPDLWCAVAGEKGRFGLWIECDTGSEGAKQWSAYFRKRLLYVHSEEFQKVFQTGAPLLAYVCLTERRRETLQRLAMGVLKKLGKEKLAERLRFTSVAMETAHTQDLFDRAVWYRPDAPTTPVPLLRA